MPQLVIYTQKAQGAVPDIGGPALQRASLDTTRTAGTRLAASALRGGMQLGEQAAREEHERSELRLATDVLAASDQYEREARAFEREFTEKHKGADAREAGAAFEQWHNENRGRYRERFAGNDKALFMFDRYSGRAAEGSIARGFAYGQQQDELYRKDTLAARETELVQFAASTDDMGAVRARRDEYAREAHALMPGRDLTAHLAGVDRSLAENAIRTRIVKGDVAGAEGLLTEYRAQLGDRYDEVAGQVRQQADKLYVLEHGQTLAQRFGGDIVGAVRHIRETEADPDRRQALESYVKSEWSFRESMEARAEREALKAERTTLKTALDAAQTPQDKARIIASASPENQGWLMAASRRSAGEFFISDKAKVREAHRRIVEGDAVDFDDYRPFINDADLEVLHELSGNLDRKRLGAWSKKRFDQYMADAKLRGTAEERKAFSERAEAEFTEFMLDPATKTREQVDAWLFGTLGRKVVVGGGWFNRDSETDPMSARRKLEQGKTVRPLIPAQHRAKAVEELKARGVLDAEGNFADPAGAVSKGFESPQDAIEYYYMHNRQKISEAVGTKNDTRAPSGPTTYEAGIAGEGEVW